MAYEGLNNLDHSGRKAIIVLNDNGRSYAPPRPGLGESLSRFPGQLHLPAPATGDSSASSRTCRWSATTWSAGVGGAKAALREMFEPPVFFEQLGVHYLGPYDGHDG